MSRWIETAVKCLRDESAALLELIPNIDENFDRTVELVLGCRGKLIVTGVGKSGHIGAKIAATLSSTGTPSVPLRFSFSHRSLGAARSDAPSHFAFGMTSFLLFFVSVMASGRSPSCTSTCIFGVRKPSSLRAL